MRRQFEPRLELDDPVSADPLESKPVVGENLHVAGACIEALLGAVEVKNALAAFVVGDAGSRLDVIDAGPGVKGQAKLAQGIDTGARMRAFGKKLPGPGDETRIEIDSDPYAEIAPV